MSSTLPNEFCTQQTEGDGDRRGQMCTYQVHCTTQTSLSVFNHGIGNEESGENEQMSLCLWRCAHKHNDQKGFLVAHIPYLGLFISNNTITLQYSMLEQYFTIPQIINQKKDLNCINSNFLLNDFFFKKK